MPAKLPPDAKPPATQTCPTCAVVMLPAHRGHTYVLYVCPCCAGALSVPPTVLSFPIPTVGMEKR
jgi:hypothetical protein